MSAYRITEVGFENTDAVFFRTTIEMASKYDIAEWLWVEDRDADVILVNSDSDECTSKFTINKPTQTNIRPILICCSYSSDNCDAFSFTLEKPITYSMIITLLLKLEKELAVETQSLSSPTQQHNELNTAQHSSKSLQTQTLSGTGLQPEAHTFSTSHPIDDTQHQSGPRIGIDEDSDYDIYDLLMDSDFISIDPEVTPAPDTNSRQTANEQSKAPQKPHTLTLYNKMNRLTRQLKKRRFLGLIRKHFFAKFRRTG